MWTRELFFFISFFTFPSIYKSASFLRSSLPQKMKRASATVSRNCTPCRPHEGACVPRLPHLPARAPGPLHSVYVQPGVCAIVNAEQALRFSTRKGVQRSLCSSPRSPREWRWLSPVLQSPGYLPVSAAVGGVGMNPLPVSLIKSPLLRHPLALQLITIPWIFHPCC